MTFPATLQLAAGDMEKTFPATLDRPNQRDGSITAKNPRYIYHLASTFFLHPESTSPSPSPTRGDLPSRHDTSAVRTQKYTNNFIHAQKKKNIPLFFDRLFNITNQKVTQPKPTLFSNVYTSYRVGPPPLVFRVPANNSRAIGERVPANSVGIR